MFIHHQGVVMQIIFLHVNETAFMKDELHFRSFIRLMSDALKFFPFAMVMCSVVWLYFCPEHILSDIVNDWHDADTLEKIRIVRLYLKMTFVCTFVGVFLQHIISDVFMSVNCRQ